MARARAGRDLYGCLASASPPHSSAPHTRAGRTHAHRRRLQPRRKPA
jgi:hypothetical protein